MDFSIYMNFNAFACVNIGKIRVLLMVCDWYMVIRNFLKGNETLE